MTVEEREPELSPAELSHLVLLTRAQAGTLAGVGLNKIDEWCREPGFPVVREGGHFVRIVRVAFEQWLRDLAARQNPPMPPPPYQRPPRRPRRGVADDE